MQAFKIFSVQLLNSACLCSGSEHAWSFDLYTLKENTIHHREKHPEVTHMDECMLGSKEASAQWSTNKINTFISGNNQLLFSFMVKSTRN